MMCFKSAVLGVFSRFYSVWSHVFGCNCIDTSHDSNNILFNLVASVGLWNADFLKGTSHSCVMKSRLESGVRTVDLCHGVSMTAREGLTR